MPRNLWKWGAPLIVVVIVATLIGRHVLWHDRMRHLLLRTPPNDVPARPELVAFGASEGAPLYQQHCASCHGADLAGNSQLGAPNLKDKAWLYGEGAVFDIERTLLYGIRSGHSKARNVTDMPGFGQRGVLSDGEIHSVVQYLLKLSGRPHQVEAANEGRNLYVGKANCGDCHGNDARGDPFYGAPNLTLNIWNSGGEPADLYKTVYFGQHRVMQAWIGTLSLLDIRALSVYLYAASHREGESSAGTFAAESN